MTQPPPYLKLMKRVFMNQMKTLFKLLNPEAASSTKFNIGSTKEFKEHWDHAVNLITPFEKSTITVLLQNKHYTYDIYQWNLWEWALELIQNPLLEPHFIWDTIQLLKWNGDAFKRYVDEPWMAQAFWDLQLKDILLLHIVETFRLGYKTEMIKEDAKFRKRVYYVDFKHHVWHATFKYILEPLFVPSRVRGWVHLSLANMDIQMFPRVPIKSCDYNEVNFVVLIQGANGLKPCVICLVPKLEQYNLDIRYELWTKQQTQEILADTAAIPTKGGRNKFLSGFGLRNIENVFWNIEECDPFCSLSFDPLHAYDNGMFGDHLRSEVVSRIQALGGESAGQADDQIKLFSRWRNLYHFESGFMAVHFADGGKYEDLSKGVTLNYNTKPNEKMHGPLKDAYQLQTNFKDVAEQQIELHDEQLKNLEMPGNDNDELKAEDTSEVSEYSGNGGGVLKIREIRHLKVDDPAFHGFQKHLSDFMVGQFGKYPEIVPKVDGQKISFKSFKPDDEIQLHGLLKVNYENMINWTTSTDYLWCSPNFYNHPRYDFLLVDSTEQPFFAQLIMIFTCVIGGKLFPLALVHPVDQPADSVTEQLDKDLGFYRDEITQDLWTNIY
ncbi:hypothetical protein IW261DRAFT_1427519 [Armillaria novae-zelandiae]|uniref:Uncharacterized protein n=1 Tax=Armillaria novae-zelandiae TaxID=153914 RepID=A0AA39NE97_9AGAR|nr:hypothetical protein IW261DRAFT_1427519 [Armillaria novae-zelandiae]